MKIYNLYPKRSALSANFSFEEQAQALLAYCHFHSFLILHFIYYISQKATLKTALELLDTASRFEASGTDNTITRAILPRNQSPSFTISNTQRGWSCEQIFDSSKTFVHPLVGVIVWKTDSRFFFSRVSHALRASRATSFARVRLTRHASPISCWFWEKKRLFWSLTWGPQPPCKQTLSYTFNGGNVVRVCLVHFFSLPLQNFHVVLPTKQYPLFPFFSLSFARSPPIKCLRWLAAYFVFSSVFLLLYIPNLCGHKN